MTSLSTAPEQALLGPAMPGRADRPNPLTFCLLALVLVLVGAAAYTSALIVRHQQAVRDISRYNTTWLVSQAALEVARLHTAAVAATALGAGLDGREIRLRLDIVANRVQLFEGGEVAGFVAAIPEVGAVVDRFRDAAREARAIVEGPPSPERLRRLVALTASLNAPMAHLASAANAHGGALAARDQRRLAELHQLLAAILSALTLCAFGLMASLAWHNRRLGQARDRLDSRNAEIAFMAHHDALTGLPNRWLFRERLEAALAGSPSASVALICLDLDRFKAVNDTLGHPAGDTLLRAAAKRLRACVREGDVVARLGGDEFAVLQYAPGQPGSAEDLAGRIVAALGAPYDLDGKRVVVGVSAGVAFVPPDPLSADALFGNADLALYRAKAEGRGTFRRFEASMDAEARERRAIESDLRGAIERGEFEVFYQPLVQLRTGRADAFEALLRWRHPERGSISPALFIPLAEELGLVGPIGEWALARACAEAVTWPEGVKVAVNVSPMQLRDPGFAAAVRGILGTSGLPARRLELEITETALLQDSETVLTALHELRGLGIRTALDDFGTGYSSLGHLRGFPFDKIKIDRSFVHEMTRRPDCLAIIDSVLGLARALGMDTTAEGVETEEQLDLLRWVGCGQVQGFLFDRPRPAAEIKPWLAGDAPAYAVRTRGSRGGALVPPVSASERAYNFSVDASSSRLS